MPIDFGNRKLFGVRPSVDLETPTEASLRAEAASMTGRSGEVAAHPADLIADAIEMQEAEGDIADLMERGYEVKPGLITRIRMLTDLIAPQIAEEERAATWSVTQTQRAEETRQRLLQLRSELAAIGKAAGLPGVLFSIETKKTTRLNVVMMKLEEVLANVREVRSHLPDPKRVDAIVAEMRQLLDEQRDQRAESRVSDTQSRARIRQRKRYERLLLDALQYLSAQGLAAYPDDPTREVRYRLDHVYGKRPSKVGDPGAGGTAGDPTAPGPNDV